MSDPYRTLGVGRDASPEQIKKAYRRQARAHHPDRNPGDPEAADRFKAVAEAYEVLSNSRRRRAFDRSGRRQEARRPRAATSALRVFVRIFDQQLRLMRGLYFEQILPRLIDRWYRGQGVELLVRMLEELEQHRLLQHAAGPPPSDAARQRAAAVLAGCPVSSRPVEMVDGAGDLVLGALISEARPGSGGEVELRYHIQLFPGSFLASGIQDPDALAAAILPVLARESIRYLETFLPEPARPLWRRAAHDGGLVPSRLTVEEARRRDTVFLGIRWGGPVLFVLLVIALLATILPAWM